MQARQGRSGCSTIGRAVAAGLAAAFVGVGLGTIQYAALPGAAELDWSWLSLAIVGFALFAGVLGGLGIGGATAWVVRSAGGPRSVGALRMVAAGAAGGLVGITAPGIFGIAGFGSLQAPYAGTGNIVFCLLVASTTFVSLWAPVLWRGSTRRGLGWPEHLGLSALAASLAIASLGILGATLCTTLGVVPTFDALFEIACAIGLVPLAVVASVTMGVVLGAAMGFACWLYLSVAMVLDRRMS
jgi:hypothetical protein